MEKINIKIMFSVMWVYVLLNLIFRDLHEFASKDFLEEALTGYVNGVKLTDGLMLLGGIMAQIPIVMVVLSLILKRKTNRLLNLVSGVLILLFLLSNTVTADMDDIFFLFFEISATLFIIWMAWNWKSNANHPLKILKL